MNTARRLVKIIKGTEIVTNSRRLKICSLLVLILLLLYSGFVNFTDRQHVGIAYNLISGDLYLQDHGGFWLTSPWTFVSRVDIRPVRVCMTSAGRGYNCKLVQFEPKAYQKFVETEGFRYYWWANRFSFNYGYTEEYRGMKDILRGYAFSTYKYSFLTVLQEYVGNE